MTKRPNENENKNKNEKHYETDHSYFLNFAPSDTVLLDEDMAKNVTNKETE